MITLHGKSPDGKNLLAIGICDGHIALMKDEGGMRIVTPEGLIIDIIYAPTEAEIMDTLKATGLLNENTEVAIENAKAKPQGPILTPSRKLITPDDSSNN